MSGRAAVAALRELFSNARIAMWRRYQYRTLLDVPKDFLFRSASHPNGPPHAAPISLSLSLSPRKLPDAVHLRVSNSDFAVFEEIFDRDEYGPVRQWNLPHDARIIDLGANIGLASLYFSVLLPGASVVAVEPDKANCRLMRRNCKRLLHANRLKICQAFIAAQDGTAGIDRNQMSWSFHKVDTVQAHHEVVPCVSMPHVLAESGFDRVDLLKCDIEGSERELFEHCAPWIGRVKHLVVETHSPYQNVDLYRDLRAAGWEFEITFERQAGWDGIVFLRRH